MCSYEIPLFLQSRRGKQHHHDCPIRSKPDYFDLDFDHIDFEKYKRGKANRVYFSPGLSSDSMNIQMNNYAA